MAEETENDVTVITVPNTGKEAQIILDWDDDQWYVSSIKSANDPTSSSPTEAAVDTTSGVKVAVWNSDYKYSANDIIGETGMLYVSMQDQNKGNDPTSGTFWWQPVVDLSNVDAITLEGKNLTEITRDILGGNVISDYYKISETKALILKYVNNINAKQLEGWSLQNIKDDYVSVTEYAESNAKEYAVEYFTSEDNSSYQKELVDLFDSVVYGYDINQG